MQRKLTTEEKIDHINRCEFHRGSRLGVCPIISFEEAEKLRSLNPKQSKDSRRR